MSKYNIDLNLENFKNITNQLFCENKKNIQEIKTICVALSGGADSMCLLFLMKCYCDLYGIKLIAVTINHNLRKEIKEEISQVTHNINNFKIEHIVIEWHHDGVEKNIQHVAREARYKLLTDFCRSKDIGHLFVAHNKDDQAETVMMRIMRGSGIDGISGMNDLVVKNNIKIVRPLLNFYNSQIRSFLKFHEINWIEDPSNTNDKFDRVKVRKIIKQLDYNFNIIDRLNLLSCNAKRAKDYIDLEVNKVFKRHCQLFDIGYLTIEREVFLSLHEEIKLRLINMILKYIHNDFSIYPIRIKSLYILLHNLNSEITKTTLGKCIIESKKGMLYFYKELKYIDENDQMLTKNKENIWDNRFKISIDKDGYYVSKLTISLWDQIKEINCRNKIPHMIKFTTPVIIDIKTKKILSSLFFNDSLPVINYIRLSVKEN
ncbi:MAG: tRNA(Ile)-lysidine synthase [Candidatus Midichloriaceae bacterium]|jgi:tRNA(Ile)-lysidine synthase